MIPWPIPGMRAMVSNSIAAAYLIQSEENPTRAIVAHQLTLPRFTISTIPRKWCVVARTRGSTGGLFQCTILILSRAQCSIFTKWVLLLAVKPSGDNTCQWAKMVECITDILGGLHLLVAWVRKAPLSMIDGAQYKLIALTVLRPL